MWTSLPWEILPLGARHVGSVFVREGSTSDDPVPSDLNSQTPASSSDPVPASLNSQVLLMWNVHSMTA